MPNVTLPRLTTGYGSVAAINTALDQLEDTVNALLSRESAFPNQMETNLDMNSKRILNCPPAANNNEPVTLGQLQTLGQVVVAVPESHVHSWDSITGKPTTFTPTTHTHTVAQVVGLQTELTGLDSRLDTLEARPRVFVQASTPSSPTTGDVWIN
jgi:hypothetical protein